VKSEVSKGTPARKGSENQKQVFALLPILAIALMPDVAMAANPWDNMLNGVIGFLNGGTTRLVAILVVIALGFLAWFGKLTMGKAGGFIGGIVLVFGAAAIADLFIATV
jgi:type IV secretion system protein VirB2